MSVNAIIKRHKIFHSENTYQLAKVPIYKMAYNSVS